MDLGRYPSLWQLIRIRIMYDTATKLRLWASALLMIMCTVTHSQEALTPPPAPNIQLLLEVPDIKRKSDDPRTRLLNSVDRIGYGSAATGGTNYVYVKTFWELKSAIEKDGNYVILDPSLTGKEMGFAQQIYPGNNITMDGSLAPGLVMFPDYSAGFPSNSPMINNIGVGGQGNKIFHSFKLEGRRQWPYNSSSQSGNVGGLFLREGSNYWIDHVEVTDFWDDAFISGIGNNNSGDYITLSNVKVHNTDKGYQAFNMEAAQQGRGHITIFNSEWGAKGRNPENRGGENFHFFNNWVHSWTWGANASGGKGLIGGGGQRTGSRSTDANMLSESNVYESSVATNNCAESADPTSNYGGWMYTNNLSHYNSHTICGNSNHISNNTGGPGKPQIPYSYTLLSTDQVKSYVQQNAGPLN